MSAQFQPERGGAALEQLRVPPHAIDAEQAVLGGLMFDPSALAKISDWLSEGDFYRKDHRLIYRAIITLIGRNDPVDPVTMGDWFDANDLSEMVGGASYMVEIANATPSAANIVAYAEIVIEKARLRSAIDIGTKLAESAWSRGAESQQIMSEAQHALSQMQISKLRGALEPVKGAMKRMYAELLARFNRGPGLLGQPWPWQDLNAATKGLRDGVLYIVGARPSMGKSVFALQTAVNNALNGNRTALFSVEMTAEECMARAVACFGRIPHEWVESPANEDEDAELHWTHLTQATEQILNAPLLIDETPGISSKQLMARVRRAHLQEPIRLLVIDHMHDMKIDPKREARFEYGDIAQDAKTLAKELRCPVVLLTQLNRSAANRADKRPTLTDLRESGEIEQKADVVLFLHREDYYDKDSVMSGTVEIIPAKGRNLRLGDAVILKNSFSEMRMDDLLGERPLRHVNATSKQKQRGFP